MRLDFPDKLFCHHPTSLTGCQHLPGARLTLHQNTFYRAQSTGIYHRWIMSQCLRVSDCKNYEVKQLLSNSTGWITERGNILNEHVLCDIEWSCDMHVVWLESKAATELTPHIWTRSVFDLRLRLNFKMQQCGCNLRQLTELITLDSICFPDLHKNKNKIKFSQKHVC